MSTRIRGYGLENLILHKTPEYIGWSVDPTDGTNITDNDCATICQTGSKIISAGYQYAKFGWDLGSPKNILISGVGACNATAGTPQTFLYVYCAGQWRRTYEPLTEGSTSQPCMAASAMAEQVWLVCTSSAASTVTPSIREFSVWNLG